jgi:hypothetical protein
MCIVKFLNKTPIPQKYRLQFSKVYLEYKIFLYFRLAAVQALTFSPHKQSTLLYIRYNITIVENIFCAKNKNIKWYHSLHVHVVMSEWLLFDAKIKSYIQWNDNIDVRYVLVQQWNDDIDVRYVLVQHT